LRITATLNPPVTPCGWRGQTDSIIVTADLRQTLQVAVVAVAYIGPPAFSSPPGTVPITVAAPVLTDVDTTLPFTLTTYPISAHARRLAGAVLAVQPLDQPPPTPGACNSGWSFLLNLIAAARMNDGNQIGWLYYGLIPNGVPVGAVVGCGAGGGVGAGFVG